ncbi:hypothetical protein V6N11_050470 [Hibiscus sabdariffa]|uniref:Retrotransposon Copia-like N-terminal domain-containing protein n=1 Tax=Hibiscus sabdariffa TaxID=183260 RepID=A0ABR2TAT3_9ROSI
MAPSSDSSPAANGVVPNDDPVIVEDTHDDSSEQSFSNKRISLRLDDTNFLIWKQFADSLHLPVGINNTSFSETNRPPDPRSDNRYSGVFPWATNMTSNSEPRQVTRSRAVPVLPNKGTPAPTLVAEDAIDSTLVDDESTPVKEPPAPELVDAPSTQGTEAAGVRVPSEASTSSHEDGSTCGTVMSKFLLPQARVDAFQNQVELHYECCAQQNSGG